MMFAAPRFIATGLLLIHVIRGEREVNVPVERDESGSVNATDTASEECFEPKRGVVPPHTFTKECDGREVTYYGYDVGWFDEDGCEVYTSKHNVKIGGKYRTKVSGLIGYYCPGGSSKPTDTSGPGCEKLEYCKYVLDCDYFDRDEMCETRDPARTEFARNCLVVAHYAKYGKLEWDESMCDEGMGRSDSELVKLNDKLKNKPGPVRRVRVNGHKKEVKDTGTTEQSVGTIQTKTEGQKNRQLLDVADCGGPQVQKDCTGGVRIWSFYYYTAGNFKNKNSEKMRMHLHKYADHKDNYSPKAGLETRLRINSNDIFIVNNGTNSGYSNVWICKNGDSYASNLNFGSADWEGTIKYHNNENGLNPSGAEPALDDCDKSSVAWGGTLVWTITCEGTEGNGSARIKRPRYWDYPFCCLLCL